MKTKLFYALLVLVTLGAITTHAQDVYRESKGLELKHISNSELWFIEKFEVDSSYTCDGISKQCKVARYDDPKLEKISVIGFNADTIDDNFLLKSYQNPFSQVILAHQEDKYGNGHKDSNYSNYIQNVGVSFSGFWRPTVAYPFNNFAIVFDKGNQRMTRVAVFNPDVWPSARTYLGYLFFGICCLYFLFNMHWKKQRRGAYEMDTVFLCKSKR